MKRGLMVVVLLEHVTGLLKTHLVEAMFGSKKTLFIVGKSHPLHEPSA